MKKVKLKIKLTVAALFTAISLSNAQSVTINPVSTVGCWGNGEIIATTNGLTTPITYQWYGNGYLIKSDTTNALTDTLFNYFGGSGSLYCYAISGGNWHSSNPYPALTYSAMATNPVCPVTIGTGTVYPNGGTPPYNIDWISVSTGSITASGMYASLPVGQYSVMVTDANGCMSSYYDSLWIQEISPINLSVSTTTANCTNGTANVTSATGGQAPYTYLWSNGATTQQINNLVTGYYDVTVTDAQGCQQTSTYNYVPQGITINANVVPTAATCIQSNGSAITFGSGGTPPYSYLYSNGQTTQTANGLPSGYYSVQVTDANGCIGNNGFSISASTPITVSYNTTASSCTAPTGSATLAVSGGVAPYTIQWGTYPVQGGTVLSNVSAGQYYFVVTDVNGCVRNGSVYIGELSNLNANPYSTNATCPNSNGTAIIYAYSNSNPITYAWSNGATTSSVSGLAAGYYSCTITDASGCQRIKSVYIGQNSIVNAGISTTQASCIYSNDGAVNANATGGTAPYSYYWSNGQTTQSISGLTSGNYYLLVVDANGCSTNSNAYVGYNASNDNCYCTVKGIVYDDANGNCTQDPGEHGINHILIKNNNTNNSFAISSYMFTDTSGAYSFTLPAGNYNIQEVVQSLYPLSTCQSNTNTLSISPSSGCVYTVDFANGINPLHDVHVINTRLNYPVPGNNYVQQVIVQNDGTVTENNIQIGYEHDGQLLYSNSSGINLTQPNASASPNWYNNTNTSLAAGGSASTLITFQTPTNIPLGTQVNFWDSTAHAAPMSNWLNDYTPWNNVNAFEDVVVGSFDPNVKEVTPKGVGPQGYITSADTVLDYVIHFQNTGTWPATKIVVVDSLDADLNWESLRPGYSNHNYTASMTNNGVVSFTFDNINLPTASSQPISSIGTIAYSIHTKKNLAQGTQFTNSASIYFDYNVPVRTNTTLNTLDDAAAGIKAISVKSADGMMALFPNPTSDNYNLKITANDNYSNAKISVYSIDGMLVQDNNVELLKGDNVFTYNTASLNTGLYIVRATYNDKQYVLKLSVVK